MANKHIMKKLFYIIPFFFQIVQTIAQPGSLDNSFNGTGYVITSISPSHDRCYCLVIQPDGKIILAGTKADTAIALVRYNNDGSLDNSFGSNGISVTYIESATSNVLGITLQNDGKIMITGYSKTFSSGHDFLIGRYNSNGSLDSTFGINGFSKTSITSSEMADGIAIQQDGKYVIAGYFYNGVDWEIAILRYKTNGIIDSTFGINGIVATEIPDYSNEDAYRVIVQPDGKIIVCGDACNATNFDFALLRYNYDGSLDSSFGTNGYSITDFGWQEIAYSFAFTQDDKIIAAGYSSQSSTSRYFALAQYDLSGKIDSTFGINGKVTTTSCPPISTSRGMGIQSDGKIVAVGDGSDSIVIVRYNKNGSQDTSFGFNGIVTELIGNWNTVWDVAIQSDDKILVAGYSYTSLNKLDFFVARFNSGYTGLFESSKNDYLIIYPNPATDKIVVSTSQFSDMQNSVLTIQNIQGQLLLKKTFIKDKQEIDIHDLAKGIYFVRLCNKEKTFVTKILKE